MSARLDTLRGAEWLVHARGEIQLLLFQMKQQGDKSHPRLDGRAQRFALGAAFSLARAAWLLYDDESERELAVSESAAFAVLGQVINTNTPSDDRNYRLWCSGYYVDSAMYRITELLDGPGRARACERPQPIRVAWTTAFRRLVEIVTGTVPGTDRNGAPRSAVNHQI